MPHLKLLGGAVVVDESGRGGRLTPRRHALALLALLATAPSRTLSRGKLVGFLWPDSREKVARNRLTSCVYEVRSALGHESLVTVGDDLRLDRDVLPCDVPRFEEALEAGEYRRAVELYGGPFLDGFQLGGSAEFEQRIDRERDRLQRAYHGALEALATEFEGRGEPATAARWWRERAAEDPYDSRVARRLMEALAAAGNRAEALRVAREHTRLLEEEFGTEPAAEIQAAVDRLQGPGRGKPADANGAAATDTAEDHAAAGELPVRSVAVLPFENLSGSEETEPFAAGLHHDLLTELSRISALRVIARTSVLRYRGTDRPVQEIARELGVGTVVEGGVQSVGGRLRLNVQLIDARTGAHRWVERYDRELSTENIFDLQSELAGKIAMSLRAELTPAELGRAGREPAEDLEAYRLYVQGRGLLDQRTAHEMYRSIEYFQRAIDREPESALAWAGLADALALLEFYDYTPPASVPDPLRAARRAVELGPNRGQTHASLGIIHSIRQQGPAALRELETAVELAPSYAEAYVWLGWVHLLRGCPKEALEPAIRAVELDPLAPAFRIYLAETWLANGEPRQALREAGRAREIQPRYGLAHFMEGLVLYHLGRFADAEPALERALALVPAWGTPTHAEVRAMLGVIRAASSDAAGAREHLTEIEEAAHPFSAGLVRAALGEVDEVFTAFARVRDWSSFSTEHFRYFFPDVLGPLREDPRYLAILRKIDHGWEREPGSREPAAL